MTSVKSTNPVIDCLVWQLLDSAYPISGFTHSSSCEAALQIHHINNPYDIIHYITNIIQQTASTTIPIMERIYQCVHSDTDSGTHSHSDSHSDSAYRDDVTTRTTHHHQMHLKIDIDRYLEMDTLYS